MQKCNIITCIIVKHVYIFLRQPFNTLQHLDAMHNGKEPICYANIYYGVTFPHLLMWMSSLVPRLHPLWCILAREGASVWVINLT